MYLIYIGAIMYLNSLSELYVNDRTRKYDKPKNDRHSISMRVRRHNHNLRLQNINLIKLKKSHIG
jgi:hypothetical protein